VPELPEVETTRRALLPHILGQKITNINLYNPNLRWKVDGTVIKQAYQQTICDVQRRAKYLIFQASNGFLLSHLGMSGHWKLTDKSAERLKHDHLQIDFDDFCLRYNDSRRFGSFQWIEGQATNHTGFSHLGIEPIENPNFPYDFDIDFLKKALKNRKTPIKPTLMNQKIIVGVGNIYANEALFLAGINPKKLAHRISKAKLEKLVEAIICVLNQAVKAGGTTLKDFINPNNKTGYFQLSLNVYGREKEPCHKCQQSIQKIIQAQRATFYCPTCQK
jgi:formamidopyrimidine-DNA glycosylase